MKDRTRTFRQMNRVYGAENAAKRAQRVAELNNEGVRERQRGNLELAMYLLFQAIDIDPKCAAVHDNLGTVYFDIGNAAYAVECHRKAVELGSGTLRALENFLFTMQYVESDPQVILDYAQYFESWVQCMCKPEALPYAGTRDPDRELRVGYVYVGQLHVQNHFLGTIYSHSEDVRVFAYQLSTFSHLTDQELAAVIRKDSIDVLVDCTMHMAGSRPLVFAHRPAPVQIAWLAYPGTTGMKCMSHRISDSITDPPGTDGFYTEQTLRIPNFWCGYDPQSSEPVAASPYFKNDAITFGCLNNPAKITPQTLKLWAPIFKQFPSARLILPSRGYRAQEHLLQKMRETDVTPAKVIWAPFLYRSEYLRVYNEIDIAIDTIPYNGHTTTLDALWMGVPVVSRTGSTCVGRGASSILSMMFDDRAACDTDEKFLNEIKNHVDWIVERRCSGGRGYIRDRLIASKMMDQRYAASCLEAAYRVAWADYCKSAK